MEEHPFTGSALCAVEFGGGLRLPPAILRVLRRRSQSNRLLVGLHEIHPCLIAYDQDHLRRVYAEAEARRLREESAGTGKGPHFARVHRLFGTLEEGELDEKGKLALSKWMRRLGDIGDSALVLGVGGAFEIWNPDLASTADDGALREMIGWRRAERALAEPSSV